MNRREIVNITEDSRGIEAVLESLWIADIIVSRDAIYFGAGMKPQIKRRYRQRHKTLRFQ